MTSIPLIGATSCDSCEPGYYQEKSGESSCIACSAGTYTDKAGMVQCLDCPAGKFSNTAGKKNMTVSRNFMISNCLRYAETHIITRYIVNQSHESIQISSPFALTPNIHTIISTGATSCSSCAPGSFQDTAGALSCDACPIGTYNIEVEASSSDDCLVCEPGSFSNQMGESVKVMSLSLLTHKCDTFSTCSHSHVAN